MNAIKPIQDMIGLPAWRFVIGCLAVLLNIGLTFFLWPVVEDGLVSYKQALVISTPVMLLLPIHFAKSFIWYYKQGEHFNFLDLIRFVMILFSIFHFVLNVILWQHLL